MLRRIHLFIAMTPIMGSALLPCVAHGAEPPAHHHHPHHASGHHAPEASHTAAHHAAGHPAAGHPGVAHHGGAHHAAPAHTVGHSAHPIARTAPVAPVVVAPAPPPLPAGAPDKGSNTGLPLPRFAAMRADEVYMRVGPGDRYPIAWVYHRRGLPVEIEREFDVWRLVEDADGQKGWVHQATLVGQRTFVIPGLPPEGAVAEAGQASEKAGDVIGRADARIVAHVADEQDARALPGVTLMQSKPDATSSVVAALRPGTVGTLKACPVGNDAGAGWCHVVVKGYSGWLPRRTLWGLLPDETITTP